MSSAASNPLTSRFWHLTSWIPFAIAVGAILLTAIPAQAQITETEYAQRRSAFAARMRDGFLVLPGAPEPARDYMDFGQDPNFFYLTGIDEPGAALVLMKQGSAVSSTLFVQPRDPAREVWSGYRMGSAGATARTGLPARPAADLAAFVDSLAGVHSTVYMARDQRDLAARLRTLKPTLTVVGIAEIVNRMRGSKSPAELDLIRKAIAITVDAQVLAMRSILPGMNEFEIEALIEYTFRRNGADRPSFASIVGSGPNSTTLHYNRNDRFMQAGELVVMDVGASYRGYAADVTRTIPVTGAFTPDQRSIYQLVRNAQAAGERAAQRGASSTAMTAAVDSVIKQGLATLGLIESPDAVYDCGDERVAACPQYRMYYMHGLGHAIGLEVHDPGTSGIQLGTLAPGDAFSIEPGIYVRANLLDIIPAAPRNHAMKARIAAAVRRYANIGVRIEDDYIITAAGVEWVSRAPREISEIEATMRQRTRAPRDPAKVEWYRATAHPGRGAQ
ncbi:MAG TPA: aminopeptidase P N-terminal domain-containing protein [Gemmatimonadaceae bacterium]|nr:aminopeptidase P N-terminal domain-containing protein [Gemmatimonadaceae bacterium]